MIDIDDDLKSLLEEDLTLFEEMKGKYVSENERIFFETLEQKECYDFSSMFDMLMLEPDNEIELYFIRCYWNEYEIGIGQNKEHFDSLKEALSMDLHTIGVPEHITLLEWLRKRDYTGVHYDRDNDNSN